MLDSFIDQSKQLEWKLYACADAAAELLTILNFSRPANQMTIQGNNGASEGVKKRSSIGVTQSLAGGLGRLANWTFLQAGGNLAGDAKAVPGSRAYEFNRSNASFQYRLNCPVS
jgi:hypothetical protein